MVPFRRTASVPMPRKTPLTPEQRRQQRAEKCASDEAADVFRRKRGRLAAGHVWDEHSGTALSGAGLWTRHVLWVPGRRQRVVTVVQWHAAARARMVIALGWTMHDQMASVCERVCKLHITVVWNCSWAA